jgi:hypothetical protein
MGERARKCAKREYDWLILLVNTKEYSMENEF